MKRPWRVIATAEVDPTLRERVRSTLPIPKEGKEEEEKEEEEGKGIKVGTCGSRGICLCTLPAGSKHNTTTTFFVLIIISFNGRQRYSPIRVLPLTNQHRAYRMPRGMRGRGEWHRWDGDDDGCRSRASSFVSILCRQQQTTTCS